MPRLLTLQATFRCLHGEAHFHPRWQQMLPEALTRLVPRGQVIVATHSPHMVEDLPAHQLFVLGDLPW